MSNKESLWTVKKLFRLIREYFDKLLNWKDAKVFSFELIAKLHVCHIHFLPSKQDKYIIFSYPPYGRGKSDAISSLTVMNILNATCAKALVRKDNFRICKGIEWNFNIILFEWSVCVRAARMG